MNIFEPCQGKGFFKGIPLTPAKGKGLSRVQESLP